MDTTGLLYAAAGVATLLAALLPRVLSSLPISMPMIFLGAGVVGYATIDALPTPSLVGDGTSFARVLAELTVVIALTGAGLALDRPVGWRRWMSTWRLLAVTMPLCVLGVALLGGWLLGLGLASALLLAAALAPTDPVLATEVQVGEPSGEPPDAPSGQPPDRPSGEPSGVPPGEDETRFALTSEAGLNDGLAFPFVYAAIAIVAAGAAPEGRLGGWLGEWLLVDVLWRLTAGLLVGLGVGWLLRMLFFRPRWNRFRLAEHAEGFVALAATFLAYGVAELVAGYGFIAVFVCACAIRAGERSHGYHRVLHDFVEQFERMLTVLILLLLGGGIARGLLADIGWREVLLGLVFLLVVRPVAGWIGLLRGRTGPRERIAISFFGVRGVGSIFYVAYAFEHAEFADQQQVWATVALVITMSVLLHGITATPAMRMLDLRRRAAAQRLHGDPAHGPATPI